MDWLDEVNEKIKRKNQILFSKDSLILQELDLFIMNQSRKAVTLWALKLAEETALLLSEKYPNEKRPYEAYKWSKMWAQGEIKMPMAKRKILDCHALAKELENKEDCALCHAVGQACSVVHTVRHAMGYPIYELTSIVYRLGADNCKEAVEKRVNEYTEKLLKISENHLFDNINWADFINQR